MEIVLSNSNITFVNAAPATGEPMHTQQNKITPYGSFVLDTIHAMYSLTINAQAPLTAKIRIKNSGLYFVHGTKNSFVTLPGYSYPIPERACNIMHNEEFNANIKLSADQEYSILILYFPTSLINELIPGDPGYKILTSLLQRNKPATISTFNFLATSQLLFHLKEIECSLNATQFAIRTINLLNYLPANITVQYRGKKFIPEQWHTFHTTTRYIRSNYLSPLSAPLIASGAKVSPHFISRLFKQFSTLKVGEYINELKILSAIPLLLNTKDTIQTIAFKVGFPNTPKPTIFDRVFKRLTGITPTQYRINNK